MGSFDHVEAIDKQHAKETALQYARADSEGKTVKEILELAKEYEGYLISGPDSVESSQVSAKKPQGLFARLRACLR